MLIVDLLPRFQDYLQNERRYAAATVAAYRSDLRDLAALCPDLAGISIDALRAYLRSLTARGISAATIERKFAALKTFWRWLRLEGLATEVLPERVQLPRKEDRLPRWLTRDELARFVNTPAPKLRERVAWQLLAWLGLRRGELLSLRIDDARVADGTIIIRGIKTKRDRLLPIPGPVFNPLGLLVSGRLPSDYVFRGDHSANWPKDQFMRAFYAHLERAGLAGQGITPHSLRHTLATSLVESGVVLPDVQTFLGHSDVKSTMKYVHLGAERLALVMQRHILNEVTR